MLSLILPTYNESENMRVILPQLAQILAGTPFEIIVVDDDSPDETWKVAAEVAGGTLPVRVIRRVGRRGLSSAVIEGFQAAKGDVLAAADADGQHDFTLLPKLYGAVRERGGIAVGSRYVPGGSVGEWDERRQLLSRLATRLAIRLCRVKVSDPMSGFFAVSRVTFETAAPLLHPRGFKILLDILLHIPSETPATELPYTFRVRTRGASKLSLWVQIQFLIALGEAILERLFPRARTP